MGRRAFLERLATALGALLAAAVGIPLIGAVVAPALRREEPHWIPVGSTVDFPVGQPRIVTFGINKVDGYSRTTLSRAIWVCRFPEDQIAVYNARCTHLGCLVSYRAESETFLSPCHGGIFALRDGRVMEGPPPRPLDRLEHRIEGGQLVILYQDFLVGTPERVAI